MLHFNIFSNKLYFKSERELLREQNMSLLLYFTLLYFTLLFTDKLARHFPFNFVKQRCGSGSGIEVGFGSDFSEGSDPSSV